MIELAGFGQLRRDSGFIQQDMCSDDIFVSGKNGVLSIYSTGDEKLELISFADKTIAYVPSEMGYPAYYPVPFVDESTKIEAVLMDLDGTTVLSEEFWMWIIERTVASLRGDENFRFSEDDMPYISGHTVSEHLIYCIQKYSPNKTLDKAREYYFMHTREQMELISNGKGQQDAFLPNEGVRDFLLEVKELGVKIGLVTSGLYEKAYPAIQSAFKQMDLGDPIQFYDSIITAGYPLGQGAPGTLGELEAKPHPWLYAESGRVGLEIDNRNTILGIEDSGAGVCAIRLAGYTTVGIDTGNVLSSGTRGMCHHYCHSFDQILEIIKQRNQV